MSACVFCGKIILTPLSLSFIFSFKKSSESMICEVCLSKFKKIDLARACLGCSRPQKDQTLCSDCQNWKKKYPGVKLNHTALFTYNEMAKEYMKEYKFQGDLVLAKLFTKELSERLKAYQKTHHIVPIPISQESLKVRGFNQVNLMLEKSGVQYMDWLSHTGIGRRQATKSRKDRLSSQQFLEVNLDTSECSQINKPILIVDDIYTTGRTIVHAKNAINIFKTSIDGHRIIKPTEIKSFSLFR